MDQVETEAVGRVVGEVVAVKGGTLTGSLRPCGEFKPPVIGDLVAVPTARAFGIIHGLRQGRRAGDSAAVEVQLLGELVPGRLGPVFSRGVTAHPPLDAPMLAASDAEINAIYARPRTAHLQIGCLRHDESLPAYLATDHLLGKNFAVLGSSGSGRSCAGLPRTNVR